MPRTKDTLISYNSLKDRLDREIEVCKHELKYQIKNKDYGCAMEIDSTCKTYEFILDVIKNMKEEQKEGKV